MIADLHTLITGSYNWTLSAARYNHENILLTREANVIKSFASEFDKLWSEMKKID
jgi:phosphatidylserine/phosphatidylglycerophosphate/cardiolipin synthase-like enzyme